MQRFRDDLDRASSPTDILEAVDLYLSKLSVEARVPKQIRRRNDSEMSYWSELFETNTELEKRKREEEEEEKLSKAGHNEESESKSSTGKRIHRQRHRVSV